MERQALATRAPSAPSRDRLIHSAAHATDLEFVDKGHVREDDLPLGAGVEAITRETLALTALLARDAFDREHVTTFVRRHADLFRLTTLHVPPALARPDVRLTVDTPEDLHLMRELYSLAGADLPSLATFIGAWDRRARRTAA